MPDAIVSKPDHSTTLIEGGKATFSFQLYLDGIEEKLNGSLLGVNGVEIPSYNVADLPTGPPSDSNFIVFVPDETAGPALGVWNGTQWRKLTLGGVVS